MNILEWTGAIFWGIVIGFVALWTLPDFWPKDKKYDDDDDHDDQPPLIPVTQP